MRKLWVLGIAVAAWSAVGLGSAQAASIGFAPSDTIAAVGDPVFVDVVVSDLGGEIVSAYDLDILFDESVLRVDSVAFSGALGDIGAFEALADDNLLGNVLDVGSVSFLSDAELLALQGGDSVTLFTIGTTVIGEGTSLLNFSFDAINDVKGAGAAELDLTVFPGSIGTVAAPAPIPEPGSALLFGIGSLIVSGQLRRSYFKQA